MIDGVHQLDYLTTEPVVKICQGDDTCLDSIAYRCRDCHKHFCVMHGQKHGDCIGVEGLPDIIKPVQM